MGHIKTGPKPESLRNHDLLNIFLEEYSCRRSVIAFKQKIIRVDAISVMPLKAGRCRAS
jgi:hypothetical protein